MPDAGLILFGHGARDARWAEPFERLRQRVGAKLAGVRIELAFLEAMEPRLPTAAGRLIDIGCKRIVIVPVFVGEGGHVRRDLAALVQVLRDRHPEVDVQTAAAVGESDAVLDALAAYCVESLTLGNGGDKVCAEERTHPVRGA